jgi:large subunit ribosomal protein L21
MFAIIETGGKQYRVAPGDVLDVELIGGNPDEKVKFERVLMASGDSGVSMGSPLVEGALVMASRVGLTRGPKIRVFKTKRRNTQRRTKGHRQHLQRVRIDEIQLSSGTEKSKKGTAAHGA